MRLQFRSDRAAFPAAAYRLDRRGVQGIAYRVAGWEVEPDADTEWTGELVRTGNVVVYMVGDDRLEAVDPDELVAIDRADYCGECGQVGCSHDGMDRGAL